MKNYSLIFGACILFLCNFVSRALGFIYKILLVRILGSEGIGLTEMVTPVYSFALVLASLGIPLAMTRLMSSLIGQKDFANIRRIWRVSLGLLIFFGLFFSFFFLLFSDRIIRLFAIDDCILLCFKMMIPAVFIVTVCSGYRAYFQAIKQIAVIGYAQNLEQFCRICLGILLAWYWMPYGLEKAVAAVSFATVAGELVGLLFLVLRHRSYTTPEKMVPTLSRRKIAHYLFTVGMPVTLQRLLMSLVLMVQSILIPNLLHHSGFSTAEATALYGNFSGVAMSLVNLPGIFTSTLSTAILPAVAEINHRKDLLRDKINQSLQLTTLVGIPVSVIFFFYGENLCDWLFHTPEAGDILRILALGSVFFYGHTILTGIMHGIGNVRFLLYNLFFSGCVLLGVLYALVPSCGIAGAAIASVSFFTLNCLLNLFYLCRCHHLRLAFEAIILKPLFAALVAWIIKKAVSFWLTAHWNLQPHFEFLLGCGLFITGYLLILSLIHGLPTLIIRRIRPNRCQNRK